MNFQNFLEEKASKELRAAIIPPNEAIKFIEHYRDLGTIDKLLSMWLNREIIDRIIEYDNGGDKTLTGLRLYFARYKEGVGRTGEKDFPVNRLTLIAAPTVAGTGEDPVSHEPIQNDVLYLDYGKPCPPICNGGI